tara:strand:+ start:307 stop:1059 length:753 start_codon:yes stop_codon:yes gene_type:complete
MSRLIFSELGTTPSDTDTGAGQVYLKGDVLCFKRADNQETNFIEMSGGKVGIGTTSPVDTLHVVGTIGIDDYINHNGDSDTYIQFTNNNMFLRAGGQGLVLDGTGNVGIGTDSPEGLLHIKHATNSTQLSANHIFGISTGGISISAVPIAKAWVNFNGTGTLAIRDSYNVASVTDNGPGDYTVNFATAMSNATYVACGESARSSNISTDMNTQHLMHTYSTGAVSIKTGYPSGVNTLEDSPHTTVVVFAS